jgi:hypothetical protein
MTGTYNSIIIAVSYGDEIFEPRFGLTEAFESGWHVRLASS